MRARRKRLEVVEQVTMNVLLVVLSEYDERNKSLRIEIGRESHGIVMLARAQCKLTH